MAWYEKAVFYHIYPLGLTGAPHENDYGTPQPRIKKLIPWIAHIREIGCNALYIGPLFESVGHGYETTDYKKLDSRLGTNQDLKDFVKKCHEEGVKVIFDGVFNHTGRDFFAFKDIQKNRESSPYKDWYCNVNFGGNTEYNDGFSYANWGGYNLLVKLNQRNPAVQEHISDAIRFWVKEFDVDGIRLDTADVLDHEFLKVLRRVANEVKPDFWLMGEMIHGDYASVSNNEKLHAVTNYVLHKALFSGHNDHNYFEIAHTVKWLQDRWGQEPIRSHLYNFVDNHDVERIASKIGDKRQMVPVHILMYTLPGVPSIYYGSEFGIPGVKENGSDWSIRPELNLDDFANACNDNPLTKLLCRLGRVRQHSDALAYGGYEQLVLTNRQYAFLRNAGESLAIVTVNNDENEATIRVTDCGKQEYVGAISGNRITSSSGQLEVHIKGCSGEIWIPSSDYDKLQIEIEEGEKEISAVAGKTETSAKSSTAKGKAEKAKDKKEDKKKTVKTDKKAKSCKADKKIKGDNKIQEEKKTSAKKAVEEDKPQKAEGKISQIPDTPSQKKEPITKDENGRVKVRENISYEEMTVEELQQCILDKMAKNGPVTPEMKKTVTDNIWHDSLVNWVKSFR